MGRLNAKAVFAAVLLLALAVRVAVVLATPDFTPATDAVDYDRHAVAIVTQDSYPASVLAPGGGPTAFRPPGFPLALAAVYEISGTDSDEARWRAGRILEVLLGVIAVALIMLIARRVWGVTAGLLSGAIAAAYPPLLLVGSSLLAESLYIPLVLGAVLAALIHRDSRRPWRWAIVSGLLAGLAALTRSNGVVVLLPLAVLVWTMRPRFSWRAARAPVVLLAAAALTLVPWTVRNAHTLDAFVPVSTQGGFALAGTFNDVARADSRYPGLWVPPDRVPALRDLYDRDVSEAALSGRLRERATDYISDHPDYLVTVALRNTARLLNLDGPGLERYLAGFEAYPRRLAEVSVYAFWLLAAVAVCGAFTRAARRPPVWFWVLPTLMALSSILFLGVTRYRAPADPFVVMLAALALLSARDRLSAARH